MEIVSFTVSGLFEFLAGLLYFVCVYVMEFSIRWGIDS